MDFYPTTFTIFDPAGRPTIKTDNSNKVIVMLEQGWSAVRHFAGGVEMPITLAGLSWEADALVAFGRGRRSSRFGTIDSRLGLGTRD